MMADNMTEILTNNQPDTLTRLRLILKGEEGADDALLAELLHQAEDLICAYTGWKEMPSALVSAQLHLAVIMYNRLGTEGESIRREGSSLMHFRDLPKTVEMQLKTYRLGRIP